MGEPLAQEPEPTTGFNIKTLPFKDTILSIKELGGSYSVQPFWINYFGNKHGILFVVDASAPECDLIASRDTLQSVLSDQRLKGKPCLIMGTHSDLKEARTPEVLEALFASVMQNRKWAMACCSAFNADEVRSALEMLIELMVAKPR